MELYNIKPYTFSIESQAISGNRNEVLVRIVEIIKGIKCAKFEWVPIEGFKNAVRSKQFMERKEINQDKSRLNQSSNFSFQYFD